MWIILKCRPGETENFMNICRQQIPGEILTDLFIFTCDRMRRYEGSWHKETKEMFPGYVFMETGNPSALSEWMKRCCRLMPGEAGAAADGRKPRRVEPEEEKLLRELGGEQHHLGMSRGYIRDGITHIVHGPLVGMERRIRKIDRHKRLAWIEYPSDESGASFTAGLEITSKT